MDEVSVKSSQPAEQSKAGEIAADQPPSLCCTSTSVPLAESEAKKVSVALGIDASLL